MALESRLILLEEIQDFIKDSEEAAQQLKSLEELHQEFLGVHTKYEDLYANKYGSNRRSLDKQLDNKELERIMHLIRAEDSQPQKTGFFGRRGMKKEEYLSLTDKLNLVESNFDRKTQEWKAYLYGKAGSLADIFKEQEKAYLRCRNDLREAEEGLAGAFPEKEKGNTLAIGEFINDIPLNPDIQAIVKDGKFAFCSEGKIKKAAEISLSEPDSLHVSYETDGQREKVNSWVRSLFVQIMAKVPLFQYEFIYLDAVNNGDGLKELLNLQNVRDDEAGPIDGRLAMDGVRLLRLRRDAESIRKELARLERYMGVVTDILQGKMSPGEYNKKTEAKIPYKVAVLKGILPENEGGVVRKLILNGEKCGILVLLIQDRREYNLPEGHQDKWRKVQETGCRIFFKGMEPFFQFPGEETARRIELYDTARDYGEIVDLLKESFSQKKAADNNFRTCFPGNYPYGRLHSMTELPDGRVEGQIRIPYAVDRRGNIVSLEIGSANYAHGLLSGSTGAGKSTAYHMIINSVVMNYHPDDVELWLVDYKKSEFSTYIKERPPHIRFIGVQRNEEFTFSFLDLLYREYERRIDLFTRSNVNNIDKYKRKYGMNSLSRILVIIDEFHLMAQQVEEAPDYGRKLENLLSEARGAGIALLLADQAVSTGLRGLSPKGKKQLRLRLAMANDKEEMRETLDMPVTDQQAVLETGEIWNKKIIKRIHPDGAEERNVSLALEKVIHIFDEERIEVARMANALYGARGALIIDGNKEASINWEEAGAYEAANDDGREKCYLHLGVPSNLDSCFGIPLIKDYGQNVVCIHKDNALQKRNLVNSINSFARQPDHQIYVMADDNDDLFCYVRRELTALGKDHNIFIKADYGDICTAVLELHRELEKRRRRKGSGNILVFWMGLESMMREFAYYGMPPKEEKKEISPGKSEMNDLAEMMLSKFNSSFGLKLGEAEGGQAAKEEETLYNVTAQVIDLVKEGSKRGIFQFTFFSDILSLKFIKMIKLENFKYKMSGYMNKDSCYEYYGAYRFMESLKDGDGKADGMMVCHDGNKARFFQPYLIRGTE